ncbi:MAG: hypothetical protein JWQ89_3306 [Devosia sp.]|uniref:RcnB family protein n=1 Tax=Devosia sp. TaxID=1871048 RepID=UPI0026360DFD|nr:RcnB family protein [Devosia sp.]MDB5541579.1 hypothetical protein [Devosia sp.]
MKLIASLPVAAALLALVAAPVAAAPVRPIAGGPHQPPHAMCSAKPPKHHNQGLARGQCFDGWRQKHAVTDYRHHGLRAPGRGRVWIETNGTFALVAIATGIIEQIVHAH